MFDIKAVSHQHSEKIQPVKVCYAPNHLHQKLPFNSTHLMLFASKFLLASTLSASILLMTKVLLAKVLLLRPVKLPSK
ncbi:hypothetical protein H4J58_00455 [Colwellia sp. MB3u-70]|uniref:hypothetical protein n=1 Tax=unclassified Colwellia TaxID=196834 RepID=UPI0015F3EA01|nr:MULTISPECIES: hypothetical protein [unclassified Colwellia]MBA6293504.1 hypothetical protein [Colwellia sp. MB3u-8]MBA6305613.1 hypothetical protein [Colwellia sp. MB3u-70]